jgi:ketosteroid isomerase-like protein
MSTSNKELLLRANDALSNGRIEEFLTYCAPEVTMGWPGSPAVWHGPEEIRKNMSPMMANGPAFKVHVLDYIVEGNAGMGHGTMKMELADGSEQTLYFSDVYHFRNGKIIKITSYMLGLNADQMQADSQCIASPTEAIA